MCQICQDIHSGLCIKHHNFKIDKDINEIYTGFCQERNHFDKLEFYCKSHNILCCSACISSIKKAGKGQHTDCDICSLEDIKNIKKGIFEENIKVLEELSNTFEDSIYKLKKIFEKINENKKVIKLDIQKIFINIRNTINEREIEILKQVDNKFDELFFKEDIIKKSEKLPLYIKNLLKKGNEINDNWNNNDKLDLLINKCLNIEKNIENINALNENIQKYNKQNIKIKINLEDKEKYEELIDYIKNIGEIYNIDFKYTLKRCLNINESRKYLISGENNNIFTKLGKDGEWTGAICEKELDKNKRHTWIIRILNSKSYNIMIGIAPLDIDVNSSDLIKSGWYYNYSDSTIYSGPSFNYNSEYSEFQGQTEEMKIFLDFDEQKFGIISDYYGEYNLYNDIPIDKPLVPIVLLFDENDSIEILECE